MFSQRLMAGMSASGWAAPGKLSMRGGSKHLFSTNPLACKIWGTQPFLKKDMSPARLILWLSIMRDVIIFQMRQINTFFCILIICLFFSVLNVQADERILDFHSDITVLQDASMTVTETICVKTEANEIKRGIYRDFPTKYKDNHGNSYTVSFDVIEIQRDGKSEPYHTESISNGTRVYVGEKNVFIPPGEYVYTITYKTDRQIGYFRDYDELYWNVTGNGWVFPINRASTTVTLPQGATVLQHAGYTGPAGSTETAYESSVDSSGRMTFATTRALSAREGLTIAVAWPKGILSEPTMEERAVHMLNDNRGTITGGLGLFLVIIYYIIIWSLVGRDPDTGTIMVRYTPPEEMSPAVMRFISNMGYDNKIFASSIINMAVKGAVTISDDDGEYTVRQTDQGKSPLAPEERMILSKLFGSEKSITLNQSNHSKIREARQAVQDFLKLTYEKIYFMTNIKFFFFGLLLSIVTIAFAGLWTALSEGDLSKFGFMSVWLSIWSIGVFVLVTQVISRWRNAFSRSSRKFVNTGSALFMTLFSLPFIGGEIFGLYIMAEATSVFMIIFFFFVIGINILFYHLLKAPTHAGRKLLDAIEGFKMFLTAHEKDRLNRMNPPEKTPVLFEKYLPYALALDVEQQWSEQFADVLARAATEPGGGYSPVWYPGPLWHSMSTGDFASSFGNSLSEAISSSSNAPGSSSGSGGGGSSGGGGGGGGGGGW